MQRGNAAFDNRGLSKEKWLLIYVDCGCDGCGNVDCGCSAIFLFDNRVPKGKYWWAGSKILLYRQHTKGSQFSLQIIFFGKNFLKAKKLHNIQSLGLNGNSGWYIAIFDVRLQNLTLNCNILAWYCNICSWYCNILAQCWIFWLIVAIYWLDNQSKGRLQWKKNVFFRALPESPNPPPPDPNSGNLVLFFSDVKIQDLKVTWGDISTT